MSDNTLALDNLNSFGLPGHALPYEEIQVLRDEIISLKAEIDFLHERLARELMEDRQRLKILENPATHLKDSSHLLDELYRELKAIGKKQVYFPEAARILKVTRQRIHQLKAAIALDPRFVMLHSESYKNRQLIRLAEEIKN